jgi:hypothetical protein
MKAGKQRSKIGGVAASSNSWSNDKHAVSHRKRSQQTINDRLADVMFNMWTFAYIIPWRRIWHDSLELIKIQESLQWQMD